MTYGKRDSRNNFRVREKCVAYDPFNDYLIKSGRGLRRYTNAQQQCLEKAEPQSVESRQVCWGFNNMNNQHRAHR